jgi:GGDEF domain-containing protein
MRLRPAGRRVVSRPRPVQEGNDLFGRAAGDKVPQTVAKRISGPLDDSQMVARLSGDELAIVAPGLSDPTVAGRIAESILEILRVRLRVSRLTRS